jgi:hypothetical protein
MIKVRQFIVIGLLFGYTSSSFAQPVTIDFGSTTRTLPYSEDGITFSASANGLVMIRPASPLNASLSATSGSTGQFIRAQSATLFDFQNLNIKGLFAPWRIETSAGGLYPLPGLGIKDVSGRAGFSGITYFDIIYDGPDVNALLDVDDIQITFVPEPATGMLIAFAMVVLSIRRHR